MSRVHVTRDVVARGIEFEIDDALGFVRLAGLDRAFEIDSDTVGKLQLVENTPHIGFGGRVVGQHVVQGAHGGSVMPLDLLGAFPGLFGIRCRIGFISCYAERLYRRLGLGERQPRRCEMPRHHGIELIECVEPLQAECVGRNRQKAQCSDQHDGLHRDWQMECFEIGHVGRMGRLEQCIYLISVPIRLTGAVRPV